jgi:5-methylcytosine-specific restriction endonuclease McrA
MEQYKTCSNCKQTLANDCFAKQSKAKDGLQSQCKDCKRKGNRITMAKWREKNPEEHRKRNKLIRHSNPAKTRLQRAARYQKNKAAENKSARNYYRLNPEKSRQSASLRKRKVTDSGLFVVTTKELKRLYSSSCYVCGSNYRIEVDHIVPIAKGGRHSIGNLGSLCRACNRSKSDKFLIVFLMQRKNLE